MTTNPKRSYFNNLAAQWDYLHESAEALAKVRQFVESGKRQGASHILDVGCGTGVLLPWLLQIYPAATCFLELDFAMDMLRENVRKYPDTRVSRVCADAQTLPFREESVDLVLCFGVLPHLGGSLAALTGLLRVLKPSGVFCVGHLMGSQELNAFHNSLGEPLAGDTLPRAQDLAEMLHGLGTTGVHAEERPDWYLVRAEKVGL